MPPQGGCWPPDLGLNSCDRGVTVQWRYTFGDGRADVAALAETGQVYAASLDPVGDGEVFAGLDVAVQALPIEGLEGECTCMRHQAAGAAAALSCYMHLTATCSGIPGGVILLQLYPDTA
jgi:hypothetical protein